MNGKTYASLAIAVVLGAAFVGFVTMHAVNTHVESADYFDGVLDSTDFYDRVYADVLLDPQLAPIVDALSGGVDIDRDRLVDTMSQLVDGAQLRELVHELVARLVAHFAHDAPLDLTFDITRIVARVRAFALDTATKTLARLTYERVVSFDQFQAELAQIVADFKATGAFPRALPTFRYSPEQGEQFVTLLVREAHLDPSVPEQAKITAQIRHGIAQGDVQRALQVAGPTLLRTLIDDSIRALTHNDYVAIVHGRDGPHYIFGPSRAVHEQIERDLDELRELDHAATVGRVACTIVFVLCIVALVALHRDRAARLLGWLGGAFVFAGALGLVSWLALRGAIASNLARAATGPEQPLSLQHLVRDVVHAGVDGFTRSIWIPSAAIAALGAFVIAAAIAKRR